MLLVIVLAVSIKHLLAEQLNSDNCGVNSVLEEEKIQSFIVGGIISDPGTWPWACSVGFLETDKWEHQCGGTLVTYRHIITAAHCPTTFEELNKADRIKVWCGDNHLGLSSDNHGVQVGDVDRYDIHPRYKHKLHNFDISVLFVKTAFEATAFVRPICLQSPTHVERSDAAYVIGWGRDRYSQFGKELKVASLKILDPDSCESAVEQLETIEGFGDDLFCALDPSGVESGSCEGDSGGPIFVFNSKQFRYELKGLVNSGFPPPFCGQFDFPGIYTRTGFEPIYRWISGKINDQELAGRKCLNGQQCIPKDSCPHVKEKHALIENETTDMRLRNKTVEDLKSLVCDEKKKMFCCRVDDSQLEDCRKRFTSSRLRSIFCKKSKIKPSFGY
eukprot:GFUD01013371.1.p1 GENE.GFUD01013371.1~~GFUD01013371.1.p1  ORF type:complete len:388 (+),score=70.77 GFUD01013371.1:140-1303(+)